MQLTEKLRKDILFALPELSTKQVKKIAKSVKVSEPTVWRHWAKLRSDAIVDESPIILAIAELAVAKKKALVARHQRLHTVEKQMSSIK